MKIIIPSKDRPMQLHLLLESIYQNLGGIPDIEIIYRASDSHYERGYELVKERFKCEYFIKEGRAGGFREDFIESVERGIWSGDDVVGLFTDDCFLHRKTMAAAHIENFLLWNKELLCFSLRLGENTTVQDYLIGSRQLNLTDRPHERFSDDCNYLQWKWAHHPSHFNYGYTFSLDGTFYRAKDLFKLIGDRSFYNPRTLECALAEEKEKIKFTPYMMCEAESSVLCNTVNCVQEGGPKSGVFHAYDEADLNERYLRGEIIDLGALMRRCATKIIRSSHDEIELTFKEYNND